MFGFEFGGPDPHNSVSNRAIKVLLGTHLQALMPKIRQRVVQGVEAQLRDIRPNLDGKYFRFCPRGPWSSIVDDGCVCLAINRVKDAEHHLFRKSAHDAGQQSDLVRR